MTALDMEKIVERSGDVERCHKLLAETKNMMKQANVSMDETQWLSLASHLSAMLYRSIHNEAIQPLDRAMFSEVSSASIELAEKVCKRLPNLHADEKYLLSIHFEAAKLNK